MKPVKVHRKPLLVELWNIYVKQKALEEQSGHDTKPDIERMRCWFRIALEERCTAKARLELFGEEKHETDNPLACEKCGDTGQYFSETAEFERMGPKGRVSVEATGIVVCFCAAGSQRNTGIAKLGRREKKGRGRSGYL